MPSMPGPLELMVIAALALIVFGPARLPEIARSIGKAVNEFRRQASDLKSEFDLSMDEESTESGPGGVRAEKKAPAPSQDPDPDPAPRSDPAPGSEQTVPDRLDPDPTVPAPDEPATGKS
jgi:TatA/E family protein of Tat protein translocase